MIYEKRWRENEKDKIRERVCEKSKRKNEFWNWKGIWMEEEGESG